MHKSYSTFKNSVNEFYLIELKMNNIDSEDKGIGDSINLTSKKSKWNSQRILIDDGCGNVVKAKKK